MKIQTTKHEFSMAESGCLYHGRKWRNTFQCLLNIVRDRDILPPKYIGKVGKLVCSCGLQEVQTDYILDIMLNGIKTMSPSKKTILIEFIGIMERRCSSVDQHCSTMFLRILQDALVKNYTHFERKEAEVDTAKAEVDLQKNSEPATVTFNLPMQHHANFLIGKGGCHIKKLCKEYKVCVVIHPRNCLLSMRQGEAEDNIMATISEKGGGNFHAAKEELITMTLNVVKKRKVHDAMVLAYRDHQQKLGKLWAVEKRKRSSAVRAAYYAATEGKKEDFQKTFSKRFLHSRSGNTLRAGPSRKVLEQGARCIQCLCAYSRDDTTAGACTYHPGYTSTDKEVWVWSCCKEKVSEKFIKYLSTEHQKISHKQTGCMVGEHVWHLKRPGDGRRNKSQRSSIIQMKKQLQTV